jgi:hypothetical protein
MPIFPLDPCNGLIGVDRRPGQPATGQSDQPLRNALLGTVQAGQEQARVAFDRVGRHGTFGQLQCCGRIHHLGWDFQ